jgi:hypothetical protein
VDRARLDDAYFAAMMEGGDLEASGELAAAEERFARAVELARSLDGGKGRSSAEAGMQLAVVRASRGQTEAALEAMHRVIAAADALEQPDSLLSGQARMARARMLAELDRVEEGIAEARASIDLLQQARGRGEHDDTVSALLDGARDMLAQMEAHLAG